MLESIIGTIQTRARSAERQRVMRTVKSPQFGARARPSGRLTVSVVVLLLVVSCKQQKNHTGASDTEDPAAIRAAAEEAIRAGTPKAAMQFRGVQVYQQAMPRRWAVCGLVAPFVDDASIFVPFVSVVTSPGDRGAAYRFEQYVGTTTAEADHAYIALVTYCYEKGGPTSGPLQSLVPMPPLPNTVRDPSARITNTVPPQASASSASAVTTTAPTIVAGQSAASGNATMRQNGNLHVSPHGPSLRVVQQGTTMHIFEVAPGGWYQVGDTSPWGWVHESMIERR